MSQHIFAREWEARVAYIKHHSKDIDTLDRLVAVEIAF
jgi:hypothetical protein